MIRRDVRAWRERSTWTVARIWLGPSRTSTEWHHRRGKPGSTDRTCGSPTASPRTVYPSRVIAIVDAYDDPNAMANMTRFRADQGLPVIQTCTLAQLTALTSSAGNPCFTKTNQTGGTSLPRADAGWSNEIDLDLQIASAICPTCSILLLEGSSSSVTNLATAVTTASNTAHVRAISNSYGVSGDYPASFAPAYDNAAKKGLAVTASSGDGGFGVLFPASATNVIGVGGTTLVVDDTGVRSTETAWGRRGKRVFRLQRRACVAEHSGQSMREQKAVADLSADADPSSGLAIYTTYQGQTGYWVFGGTSLASPLVAGAVTRSRAATTLRRSRASTPGALARPISMSRPGRTGRAAPRCCATRVPVGMGQPGAEASPR